MIVKAANKQLRIKKGEKKKNKSTPTKTFNLVTLNEKPPSKLSQSYVLEPSSTLEATNPPCSRKHFFLGWKGLLSSVITTF